MPVEFSLNSQNLQRFDETRTFNIRFEPTPSSPVTVFILNGDEFDGALSRQGTDESIYQLVNTYGDLNVSSLERPLPLFNGILLGRRDIEPSNSEETPSLSVDVPQGRVSLGFLWVKRAEPGRNEGSLFRFEFEQKEGPLTLTVQPPSKAPCLN